MEWKRKCSSHGSKLWIDLIFFSVASFSLAYLASHFWCCHLSMSCFVGLFAIFHHMKIFRLKNLGFKFSGWLHINGAYFVSDYQGYMIPTVFMNGVCLAWQDLQHLVLVKFLFILIFIKLYSTYSHLDFEWISRPMYM